jgi:hypothetical protein
MEHKNDFLKILDSVQRVKAPSELYGRIVERLHEQTPFRWRLLAGAAAAILIVFNLSFISLVIKPNTNQSAKSEISNPFLDSNELSYE